MAMRKIIAVTVVCFLATMALAQSQFSQLASPSLDVRSVVWNPQVGKGSEYDLSTHNGTKTHISFIIVSTENANRQTSYWLETGMTDKRLGQVYQQSNEAENR